jgi:hypothetical protein
MAAGHRAATRSVLEGREHAGRLAQIEMSGTEMNETTVLALGLGLTPPWRLVNQRLETGKQPHELHLEVAAERGSLFPCPVCAKPCKAHDFTAFSWRHLNFFQHHCSITAKLPRTDCTEHGVLRMTAPWAREGSRFTLLFEQAALMLVREMPVLAAARIIEITDKRLWRIVEHYVGRAVARLDLSTLGAVGLDETAAIPTSPCSSISTAATSRWCSSHPGAARKPWRDSVPSWPNMAARPAASLRGSVT